MRRITFLLLIIAGMLSVQQAIAQTSRFFTTADGLASSHIQDLYFDRDDFLWVTTDLGLSRFNGNSFISYETKTGSPYHLQEGKVNTLYVDTDGHHWIGAADGLYYNDHTENSFTLYPVIDGHLDISVSDIQSHPLRAHKLLMCTYGYGMRCFDTETRKFDNAYADSLIEAAGSADSPHMLIDSKDRLWIFRTSWITLLDLKTMERIPITTDLSEAECRDVEVMKGIEDLQHNCIYLASLRQGLLKVDLNTLHVSRSNLSMKHVTSITKTPDQNIIVGTEGEGLWSGNLKDNTFTRVTTPSQVDLNTAKIHSLGYDAQKNLWLGIYQKGILMLPGQNSVFEHKLISASQKHNIASVTGFAYNGDGHRAYALDGGGIVVEYTDGSVGQYNTSNSVLQTNAIISITALPDGRFLAGTYRYGIYSIERDRKLRRISALDDLNHAAINDFEIDTLSHKVYIATNGQGLHAYDYKNDKLEQIFPSQSVSIQWCTDLYLCSHNNLWISTSDHLHYIDLATGEISTPKQSSSVVTIYGFAETGDGNIWMASNYGLLRYNHEKDSMLIKVEEPDDEPQRHYSGIMSSSDGRLWLSSTNCVSVYDPQRDLFTRYNDPAIASIGTFCFHSSKRWPDNTFSFGGDNGVLTFCPSTLVGYRRPACRIIFTNLWVNNGPMEYNPELGKENVIDKAVWAATELTLPANRASFSVSYRIMDKNGDAGISYSYRLKGFENEWHKNHGAEATANYQSLKPGNYVLEVKAMQENDPEGLNTVIRELKVTILPPWYATWWASAIWLALLLLLGYWLSRLILDHRREKNALMEAERSRQIKEDKLNMLTSVSHEIKTPLTLIISPLRKLLTRKSDPATQSVLEMMYRNILCILKLVNQQMDVRKMDRGELQLHVQELSLMGFLHDMMQYFSNIALNRHLNYSLSLPEGKEEMTLWADPNQLDKVILNLLSNAVKYAPDKGEVSISVSPIKMPSGADGTRITVFNSGSQLPPDQQEKAFSGISLSIALELTQLHRGTLSVRNVENGVAFDVDLLNGNEHFTETEKKAIKPTEKASNMTGEPADGSTQEVFETPDQLETLGAITALESSMDNENASQEELLSQLNDELREKQRQRKRRSDLSIDYSQTKMSSSDEKLMRRVMDVIHKNMGDPDLSVETLSQEVGISRVHLNRKMKELIDSSPSQLIKNVRLKQAAYLLIQSDVTVAEVAYSVGFSSPAYFTSNFSQFYGMTPKEFVSAYTENPDSQELKQLLDQ